MSEKVQKLQQQLQQVLLQKEQYHQQLREMENALKEVENAKGDVYKVAGPLLIKKDKDLLIGELKEGIETLQIRMKALDKQENIIRDKLMETLGTKK